LGTCDPKHHLGAMAALALLVAFLSASQDVVIDAWRVEILPVAYQGPGAGMIQSGYRIAMLVSGAGALIIADYAGWFAAYATMAGVMATPLYISLGFSLTEIAAMSKLVGFFATIIGALLGGVIATRFGILRSLLVCGMLQSAGNLFYVLQAIEGHRVYYLALCV